MNRKKIVSRICGIVVLILVVAFGLYLGNYYHATDYSKTYINGENARVTVEQSKDMITFGEDSSEIGIIFYPGGKVEYEAYAPLLEKCAEHGIFVVDVKMPLKLAFTNVDGADEVIDKYPNIQSWYICGHSLGGAMASMYAFDHPDKIDGLILLASYSTKDLTDTDLRVLSIYGQNDGVLNRENYENDYSNLPDPTEYVIAGGNHGNFGDYGFQKGDLEPSISSIEQADVASEIITEFIFEY